MKKKEPRESAPPRFSIGRISQPRISAQLTRRHWRHSPIPTLDPEEFCRPFSADCGGAETSFTRLDASTPRALNPQVVVVLAGPFLFLFQAIPSHHSTAAHLLLALTTGLFGTLNPRRQIHSHIHTLLSLSS